MKLRWPQLAYKSINHNVKKQARIHMALSCIKLSMRSLSSSLLGMPIKYLPIRILNWLRNLKTIFKMWLHFSNIFHSLILFSLVFVSFNLTFFLFVYYNFFYFYFFLNIIWIEKKNSGILGLPHTHMFHTHSLIVLALYCMKLKTVFSSLTHFIRRGKWMDRLIREKNSHIKIYRILVADCEHYG